MPLPHRLLNPRNLERPSARSRGTTTQVPKSHGAEQNQQSAPKDLAAKAWPWPWVNLIYPYKSKDPVKRGLFTP